MVNKILIVLIPLLISVIYSQTTADDQRLYLKFLQKIFREEYDEENPIILGLGDSICEGVRNNKKGFIGDLGFKFVNIGVGGATLSTANPNRMTIPNQLINYYNKTYHIYPNIIIANGGVNDYFYMAKLGNIPKAAVKTDEEAEALDKDSVLGALEYLFYKMIKYYPKAYRIFILGHKTTYKASTKNSTFCDWTITKNPAGYTQTELYDYFKLVCDLYGVVAVDIFNEGILNSAFDCYVSKVAYSKDPSVTYYEFIDSDRLHPLEYGYRKAYVPLIKDAVKHYLTEVKKEEKGKYLKMRMLGIIGVILMIL